MATYASNYASGQTDTNVFDTNLLTSLLRSVPQGAVLSTDGLSMDYDFSETDKFTFFAQDGFSAPWVGAINGIITQSGVDILSIGAGFAVDGTQVQVAIANGNADALNTLFWSGNDHMVGGASDDTLRGFGGRDALLGGAGNDTLIGDLGNDRLVGGNGDDLLFGGEGNDRLFGASGSDVLVGGAGRDLINGGTGGDIMTGGAGTDTFEFAAIREFGVSIRDHVRDFSHADGDKIDLHLIDADTATEGNQAFTFVDGSVTKIAALAVSPGGTVTVDASAVPGSYFVTVDIDGDGRDARFFVTSLDGALTADDFIL